jgi:argininosuccinate lyase
MEPQASSGAADLLVCRLAWFKIHIEANVVSLGATDPLMEAYNESLSFDRAFYAQDILGSIAFARANVTTGILTQQEFETIEKGLKEVLEEWKTNKFVIKPGADEDVHTANERRLGEIIGTDIAGKLHTYVHAMTNF